MKKYIDVDLLKSELCNFITEEDIKSNKRYYWEIFDIINSQPAADVEEVNHGNWIDVPLNVYNDRYGMNKYNLRTKCSVCEYAMPREYPRYNICPNCGAKMDKE